MADNEDDRGHNRIQEWLIPLLVERGLSVERFSQLVDVSKNSIYNYMHDTMRPTPATMQRMCEVLEVPIEEGMSTYTPNQPKGRVSRRRG